MSLFHPRVLQKSIKGKAKIPAEHHAILKTWAKNLAVGIYDKETENDAEFIQRILIDILGYVGSSTENPTWSVAKNQPVGSGNVDVALGKFSKNSPIEILAPFELKGAKTKDLDAVMSGRNKSPVQQAWEYAIDAKGAKWVLVSNYREIRLYAFGYGRKDYESFDLSTMTDPDNYHRFQLLLSSDNMLSNKTLKLLKDSDETEKDITNKLYGEYKRLRIRLIDEIIKSSKMLPITAVEISQTILDRILFIAFAEDKGLLKKDTLKEAFEHRNLYSQQPAWDNFKGLFKAVDKGSAKLNIPEYNGGLFAENKAIDALNLSDDICNAFANIGEYDFDSDVSVNILGHIFEQSISDIEEIKKGFELQEDSANYVGSKRRTDGIFYTPPFITRYIVDQAVGKWLADRKDEIGIGKIKPLTDADYASIKKISKGQNYGKIVFNARVKEHITLWEKYRDVISAVKIVDPACGSGAFLNEVFDFLYREGELINSTLAGLYNGQTSFFRWDTLILKNNIYGVDINKESVEITKLSLWLKTASRNEKLSYLNDNIKVGNSVIRDQKVSGNLAFDWNKNFPEIMQAGGFDIVIANPPYVDSEAMTKFWPKEREYLTANFKLTKGNWDLYIAFLELAQNLLSDRGYISFITPDKWLSKDFGIETRKRFLPGLISLLPVGRAVFEGALVDSLITVVGAKKSKYLDILAMTDGEVTIQTTLDKKTINGEDGFDQLLSPYYELLTKLEDAASKKVKDFAAVENACATSDTYILGDILYDAKSRHGYNRKTNYKIANTGTLNKYGFRWGVSPMKYLKHDYLFPIVEKAEFKSNLGTTYNRRAASPKLIIKGLTLLDAAIDLDGSFVPGKSTIVIMSGNTDTLKMLAAIVNSRMASFYVKHKYSSSSYNGGVNFTTDMLDSIPIPKSLNQAKLIYNVNIINNSLDLIGRATDVIYSAIRASVGGGKLGRKLHEWFNLTKPEFVAEIEKRGVKMGLKDKIEWGELFDKQVAEIEQDLVRLAAAKQDIDSAIFLAFGLTTEEQMLMPEL